ncbi:CPBP family intramembrane glutamic endopeptidase [Candidatus Villigracilis affinis]|uniref:CPBP family intramembrane glutamic endopeptidase n=1 Tax=Candidatus Villigracilis affinis TaxID=3140682 RepID=UPI001DDF9E96|nr:CPBP family intramembrane metalloprotease [Anaerolineales bacterium]
MVITTGVVMAWLRMKSDSIWPVVVMHALHNGLIGHFGIVSPFFKGGLLILLLSLALPCSLSYSCGTVFCRRPLQVEDDEKKSLG